MHIGVVKEERQEQLNLADGLSRLMMSYTNLPDYTEALLQEMKKYISIDWAAIAYIQDSTFSLSSISQKMSIGDWEDTLEVKNTPISLLVEKKHALLESDLRKSKFKDTDMDIILVERGIRTMVYMPLFSGKEIFGSFIVGSNKVNAYRERELKLIKYTTTQLSTVLERFRSLDASTRDREALDWFKAIFHYTKTPLTPIMSSSGLLTEEIHNQGDIDLLPLAQNTDRAVHRLWQNLELFERIADLELSRTRLTLKSTSPRDVLMEAASYAHSTYQRNARFFVLDIPAELPEVRTDPSRLEQVLRILLDAVLRRTEKSDTISLRAYVENGEVIMRVTDSGPILSSEEKTALVQPYNPAQADLIVLPELTLSLAICRRMIQMSGGRLWVESEPGKGTSFAFALSVTTKINGKNN